MPAPARRATYQDVLDAPENLVAEVIDGVLYTQSRPAGPHILVAMALGADLHSAFQRRGRGPGGWWIVAEPEIHLGEDILVPDIAGWRDERLPEYPSGAFVTTAPDFVAEILSPSTTRKDRALKLPVYAREGVRFVWLVDPIAKLIEVYRLDGARWTLDATYDGEAPARIAPFDAVELALPEVFATRKAG